MQLTLGNPTGTLADDAYVYFQAGATTGVDAQYDGVKLPNPSGLNLATVAAGTAMVINGLPLRSPVPRFELVFGSAPVLGTAAAQVLVYPNPVHNQATLELPAALSQSAATLALVDALGRTVCSQSLPTS